MSLVQVENGRVIFPIEGPYELPAEITPEFLDAVFASPRGDPGHIAELHAYLRVEDKHRFQDACETLGEDYFTRYAMAAVNYASVAEDDGIWRLRNILYSCKVNSWLIDVLHADGTGFWYAVTPHLGDEGILTLSDVEFQIRFGPSIADHLRDATKHYECKIIQVVDAIEDPWVGYLVTVYRDGTNVVTEKVRGPQHIPPKEWKRAPGDTFLSAEHYDTSTD